MRKFSLYIFSVLVATIALLYLLDYIYTYAYIHGTPRNKVSYLLSLENERIDYVFLGSSRVDNNIDAAVVESITGERALNLGIQGADIDDYSLMLQLLERQNIETELVFIQVDYVFNSQGDSQIMKSNLIPFIEDEVIASFIADRDSKYWYLKHIPFYRHLKYDYKLGFREFFNTIIGNEPSLSLENGYFPKYGSSGAKMEFVLPEKLIQENQSINNINTFASQNDIEVIYFMAPLCSGTKNVEFSEKLEEKLPNFINFTTTFFEDDRYFFDCGHLNDSGAKEFSKILAETILKID